MKSLANMIGDFTTMHRTPDYKAKSPTMGTKPGFGGRRHSLNLAVGVSSGPLGTSRRGEWTMGHIPTKSGNFKGKSGV
ncbi:hypothetical protein Tcan_11236 [Toxocara canis]|uniref:Uncharacterized protein n=1 Tax=Toxocara canis TaxID=6265 RepID=A0A0B2V5U7_TOXCA|nr:hypothetical protein Tcan_11236 [Toxocara canis]